MLAGFTYAEATWTQTLPDWICSHVRMFRFFEGVPRLTVPDNLNQVSVAPAFAIPRSITATARGRPIRRRCSSGTLLHAEPTCGSCPSVALARHGSAAAADKKIEVSPRVGLHDGLDVQALIAGGHGGLRGLPIRPPLGQQLVRDFER